MRSKGSIRFMGIFAIAALVLLTVTSARSASYRVLYNFNRKNSSPSSGLIADSAGNVYGTTLGNGVDDYGTVYELSPATGFHVLYSFKGADGREPQGNLVFDSAGNAYGTTIYGGSHKGCSALGCGVVFKLTPPSNGGEWTETVLYSFCSLSNCADGANPHAGIILDVFGNLYGTTMAGGTTQNCVGGCGTVFELSPTQSGWTGQVLYSFLAGPYGAGPMGSLVFDAVGNLYGTTGGSGSGNGGTVFELSPSNGSWLETVLYNFDDFSGSTDGVEPAAGLIFDAKGNLYGTTTRGGAFGSGNGTGFGTVFELSPGINGWTETILYSFGGENDGSEPKSNLVFDASGNLYGTTFAGGGARGCLGNGCGTVFNLTPNSGSWIETLFRFPINDQLGMQPNTPVLLDSAGNVYGTTTAGGAHGANDGVVFRIIP
jgi:uncharacterized repeat protein (TIGR03803 family)